MKGAKMELTVTTVTHKQWGNSNEENNMPWNLFPMQTMKVAVTLHSREPSILPSCLFCFFLMHVRFQFGVNYGHSTKVTPK